MKYLLSLFIFLISSCSLQKGETNINSGAYPNFAGPDDPDRSQEEPTIDLEYDWDTP